MTQPIFTRYELQLLKEALAMAASHKAGLCEAARSEAARRTGSGDANAARKGRHDQSGPAASGHQLMVAYTFKGRFVAPIAVGLGIPIPAKRNYKISAGLPIPPKRHTFRAVGKRRHAQPGEILQLYFAMRSPDCFLIGEAVCTDVLPATIWPDTMTIMIAGTIQTAGQIRAFVRNDGFGTIDEARKFFGASHRKLAKTGQLLRIEGVIIKWRPIDAA